LSGSLFGLLDKTGGNVNGLSGIKAGQIHVGYSVINYASP
jgi:hypothetical protein